MDSKTIIVLLLLTHLNITKILFTLHTVCRTHIQILEMI